MSFSLYLQDPASGATTLLELLLETSDKKDKGAGVFAFASTHGARLLLTDPDFQKFLDSSEFELVVGVDAVTVPSTLEFLKETEEKHAGFTARAFFHKRPGTLFHPKFCWFSDGSGGRVVIGSGNLTRGGLLKNWEAFGRAALSKKDAAELEGEWSAWKHTDPTLFRPVDDSEVLRRAKKNVGEKRRRHEEVEVEEADEITDVEPSGAEILMAEIPRASDRWNQANFDLDSFTGFFELKPGTFHRVILYPVTQSGKVGDPEVRQSVSVKSRNFRVELGQAAGLSYPTSGRPIGVFLRIGTRRFRYRLLMPGRADYPAVRKLLSAKWRGRSDRMKRVRVSAGEFRKYAPNVKI